MESRNLRWAMVGLIAAFWISMGMIGAQEVGAKETLN